MAELKLESVLAKLEEEGYGYVDKTVNVSPDSSTSSLSDDSDDSTHIATLKEQSTLRPESLAIVLAEGGAICSQVATVLQDGWATLSNAMSQVIK